MKKLWYVHTMEQYLVIKRDACESILKRWMKLELMQIEVKKRKTNIVYEHVHTWNLER